jgi:hypothetical protein
LAKNDLSGYATYRALFPVKSYKFSFAWTDFRHSFFWFSVRRRYSPPLRTKPSHTGSVRNPFQTNVWPESSFW